MKTYQYQLLRYVHDQFTGEFLNVGVVVYSPANTFLDCRVTHKTHRLQHCFPSANGRFSIKVIRSFETRVRRVAHQLVELYKPSTQLEQITNALLPPDNSALQLSAVMQAIDIDMTAALNGLFCSLVEKYEIKAPEKESLSDEDVWRLKYKKYFDEYQVSNKLTTHKVATKTDTFVFDKAWKNGHWHCFEPVSFALANEEGIKEKVYRWAGRVQGMQQATEKIDLTLLASLNGQHSSLKNFINSYLQVDSGKVTVTVIMDTDAESTARKVKELIAEHGDG